MGFVIALLSNSIGLWLAQQFVAGFVVVGGLKGYLIAGILLGLLNIVVRPILKLVSLPLMILTLGLFSIILNAALIWIVSRATGYIIIQSWEGLLLSKPSALEWMIFLFLGWVVCSLLTVKLAIFVRNKLGSAQNSAGTANAENRSVPKK